MTYETQISEHNIQEDSIKIRGIVKIKNGENIILTKNKFTQSMLAWFANMCSISYVFGPCCIINHWSISTYDWDISVGLDQSTPTAYNTIALTNPLSASSNSKSGSTANPSNGIFRTIFTATWNPYTVSGIVGEMALYLSVNSTLQPFGWGISISQPQTETKKLVSRLSSKDGDFLPFAIDQTHPLAIAWTIELSFG